jgi:succinoglycan biosynthesis transport protein ExoP
MQQVKWILSLFTSPFSSGSGQNAAAEKEELRMQAVEHLQKNMYVQRVKRTYVLNVQFTWSDPVIAARIAGAFADAYLADQVNAKYDATRRAGIWMQERLTELRQKALESDRDVQKFRADNGLISANGLLVSEQQLAEVNSQLILALSDKATAQAKLKRIQSIIDSGDTSAAVTESIEPSSLTVVPKFSLKVPFRPPPAPVSIS